MGAWSLRRAVGVALMGALVLEGAARAQVGPPLPPVREDSSAAPGSKLGKAYKDFRDLKKQLPFGLGAGIFLYMWQPVDKNADGAGGRLDTDFELWALWIEAHKEWQGIGGQIEVRVHDKSAARSIAPGVMWLQKAYAFWKPHKLFNVKLGKIYRGFGLEWATAPPPPALPDLREMGLWWK